MPHSEPMKPVDRAWLRMDEPANLMIINSLMFFARPVDRARLEAMLGARLAQVHRFRQRAVRRSSARWEWEEAPDFRVGDHILEHTLPPGSGEEALRAYASAEMMRDLPRDRPLWLVHVVHGYQGGSALLWRLHHCMGDGIALMVLMLAITDLDPDADLRRGASAWGSDNPLADLFGEVRLSPQEALRHLEQMMPEGARLLARPGEQLARSNRWLRRAAWGPTFLKLAARWPDQRTLKGKLGGTKRVAWSRAVPLAEVRLAKEAVGGTVNDVLIATIAGGLRRYIERRGAHPHRVSLRAVVPVSLRPLVEMSDLGNRFGLVFLSLPVGVEEPRARLHELQRRMRALKGSMEAVVVMDVLSLLGRVPKWVQDLVIRIFGTKGTAVLSSVPGPSRPLYVAGQPIAGFVFWVPQSGRLGIGISVMTYNGQVRLGVATDANIVPDPEAIVAAFEEELHFLEELKEASAAATAIAAQA
ncbi:MAG TPA: wax ester/triacylglycerol synthase family O-acyltransferase [Thermoanaerobaculia bacterium]|nr:wax ester/triacylglycerol synthase family O-acyltransferase [Thermoanaerobaculia bacterium]